MNATHFGNRGFNFGFDLKPKSTKTKDFLKSLVLTTLLFWAVILASQAYAASSVVLSVVVTTSFTFNTTTNNFPNISPGAPAFATTTLIVNTNDTNGWNITYSGDNKNLTNNNFQLGTPPATSTQITDQTEWVAPAATTSAGNAVRISSLTNSGNVLAFRVMSASSTNGVPFFASSWWGSTDNYSDSATTLWAGISSSTVQRQIGNAGAGSYTSTDHINTVVYYLKVASNQPTGAYYATTTFTGTGN